MREAPQKSRGENFMYPRVANSVTYCEEVKKVMAKKLVLDLKITSDLKMNSLSELRDIKERFF